MSDILEQGEGICGEEGVCSREVTYLHNVPPERVQNYVIHREVKES